MTLKSILIGIVTLLFFSAPSALAQINELRFGLTEFDETTTGINWGAGGGAENSVGLNGEVIFNPIANSQSPWMPRPYIGGMVNLAGDTSYVGAGLTWRAELSEKFYGDFGIGVVLHDGTKEVFTLENIEREGFQTISERSAQEISFGSRYLFKPQLTLGYRIDERWAVEVFGEHMSNGYTADVNQGVDNIGMRIARRF